MPSLPPQAFGRAREAFPAASTAPVGSRPLGAPQRSLALRAGFLAQNLQTGLYKKTKRAACSLPGPSSQDQSPSRFVPVNWRASDESSTRTHSKPPREGSHTRGTANGPCKTTTEDKVRITHLHTRNRPCSMALRRHSGHGITAFLAVFSVVVKLSDFTGRRVQKSNHFPRSRAASAAGPARQGPLRARRRAAGWSG